MTEKYSQIKLIIRARLPDVSILGVTVRVLAAEFGLSMVACTEVELAVVEAATNVVKYGLPNQPYAEIHVTILADEQGLVVILQDQGVPMPEESLVEADGSVFNYDLEDMTTWPTFGMGLSLIKAVMDEVQYTTDTVANTLTLMKRNIAIEKVA